MSAKPWCKYPDDCDLSEEEHGYCHARDIPGHRCAGPLSAQHFPRKGMGGRGRKTYGKPSRIVATLCLQSHLAIDNGFKYQGRRLQNDVEAGYYRIVDRDSGEVLVRREL